MVLSVLSHAICQNNHNTYSRTSPYGRLPNTVTSSLRSPLFSPKLCSTVQRNLCNMVTSTLRSLLPSSVDYCNSEVPQCSNEPWLYLRYTTGWMIDIKINIFYPLFCVIFIAQNIHFTYCIFGHLGWITHNLFNYIWYSFQSHIYFYSHNFKHFK